MEEEMMSWDWEEDYGSYWDYYSSDEKVDRD